MTTSLGLISSTFLPPALIGQSSSSSTTSFDRLETGCDSSSSSDEEDGVFFGAHDIKEHHHLSKLEEAPPHTPTSVSAGTRIIRKKDSREFHRRQTMLHTVHPNILLDQSAAFPTPVKRYPGGFYEKGTPRDRPVVHSDSEEEDAEICHRGTSSETWETTSDSNDDGHCDLTIDFNKFRLTDSPFTSAVQGYQPAWPRVDNSARVSDEDGTITTDDDSDKENVSVAIGQQNEGITAIFDAHALADLATTTDLSDQPGEDSTPEELDMGGLRVTDFSDPETEYQTLSNGRILASITDNFDDYDSDVAETFCLPVDQTPLLDVTRTPSRNVESCLADHSLTDPARTTDILVNITRNRNPLGCDELLRVVAEAREQKPSEVIVSVDPVRSNVTSDGGENSAAENQCTPIRSMSGLPAAAADQITEPSPDENRLAMASTPNFKCGQQPADLTTSITELALEESGLSAEEGDMLDSCANHRARASSVEVRDERKFTDHSGTPALLDSPESAVKASCQANSSTEAIMEMSDCLENDLRKSNPVDPSENRTGETGPSTPQIQTKESHSAVLRDESPLPADRGGFVVIPSAPAYLTHSIRADPSSPCRALPHIPAPSLELQIAMGSPIRVDQSPISPILSATPKGRSTQTPSMIRQKDVLLMHKAQTTASPSSALAPNQQSQKVIARAAAIRHQLDSAFVSRLGPPQRSTLPLSLTTTGANKSTLRPPVSSVSRISEATKSRLANSTSSNSSLSSLTSRNPPATTIARPMPGSEHAVASSSTSSIERRDPATHQPLPTRSVALPKIAMVSRPSRSTGQTAIPRPTLKASRQTIQSNPPGSISRSTVSANTNRAVDQPSARAVPTSRVITAGGRPALGLPSRNLRMMNQQGATAASSMPCGDGSSGIVGLRSPLRTLTNRTFGTPTAMKKRTSPLRLGTPSRAGKPNTPSKSVFSSPSRASSTVQTVHMCTDSAITGITNALAQSAEDDKDVFSSLEKDSLPPSNMENSEEVSSVSSKSAHANSGTRGLDSVNRPRRSTRPVEAISKPASQPRRPAPQSNVPGISQKELLAATRRNTSRNEVYHCAIERQVLRKDGPRPPSPTSKIRTQADREEEERKSGRNDRAKRRSRGSDDDTEDIPPAIQRIACARGAGEDEDWRTPGRAVKKPKMKHERNVRWDKELTVIRDDGRNTEHSSLDKNQLPLKSSLKASAQVNLDHHGNLIMEHRPRENLKRMKILVTAIIYDGEESPRADPQTEQDD